MFNNFSEINLQARAFLPVAEAVLADVFPEDSAADETVTVVELRNGRERGYCVSVRRGFDPLVYRTFFAEERCSDSFFLWAWHADADVERPAIAEPGAGVAYDKPERSLDGKPANAGPDGRWSFSYLDFNGAERQLRALLVAERERMSAARLSDLDALAAKKRREQEGDEYLPCGESDWSRGFT